MLQDRRNVNIFIYLLEKEKNYGKGLGKEIG